MIARRLALVSLCSVITCAVGASAAQAAGPPVISEQWVTSVSAESATFHAQINPNESDTKYRFEYGTSASYGAAAPIPDGDIGSGAAAISISAHVAGLASSTTYHFRVTAINAAGTTHGNDATLMTQPAHTSSLLPDGREYELVSPANKQGALIELSFSGGGVDQASEDGMSMTYITTSPMVAAQGNDLNAQVLSTRGTERWISRDIESPHVVAGGPPLLQGTEYRAFSTNLTLSELDPWRSAGQPTLSPEAAEGLEGGYLREMGGGLYTPLVTAADVSGEAMKVDVEFADASPDLKHIVFASEAALTPKSSAGSRFNKNLYEWNEGKLSQVNIINGSQVSEAYLGGLEGANSSFEPGGEHPHGFNLVSTDGSRVFWSAEGKEYVSDPAAGTTTQIDEALGGGAKLLWATLDGRYALLEHGGLYRYDTSSNSLEALPVGGGVWGMSDDGNTVYAGGYVEQRDSSGWKATFIASLSEKDYPDWNNLPYAHVASVTGNGRFAAFMSDKSLTGYDNRDVNSGKSDMEVYLYDAIEKQLTCVSCNPTGARPEGEEAAYLEFFPFDYFKRFQDFQWFAASVPTYTQLREGFGYNGGMRQPRYLLSDGRVFFNSRDPISPLHTGGHEEVYEYEPDGVGSCGLSAGCVYLISSGVGTENSTFMDASASGDDVFFRTPDRLVPEDKDGFYDVYDAHACTSAVPCFPREASPPLCTTADSCRVAPSPQPTLFGAPSSETFEGHGNLTAQSSPSTKHVTTRSSSRLNAALRACKRRDAHNSARRRHCERAARTRYGHGANVSRRGKGAGFSSIKGRR